jgi:D-alanyl-D-alanine carboxypeptidase/D-alanyl-D-alanine-endopeptidase (penicillin-binding protein 4)
MVSNEKLGYMSDEKIIDTLLKTDLKSLPQKPKWVDGSGLSRYNLFTPQDFVFILNKIKNEFDWQRVKTIFPAGNEGTLKGFYQKYSDKIFAKTGSLSNNISLSGFLTTNAGKELIFSIIINNHQTTSNIAKVSIEKYLTDLIENN